MNSEPQVEDMSLALQLNPQVVTDEQRNQITADLQHLLIGVQCTAIANLTVFLCIKLYQSGPRDLLAIVGS
ncbi:hypothetical protein B0H16DRAFT_1725547 [Mycena metata]|uniref:Uncharacterized protein n=1 Tax=Mycena metata TaxID=1033252 RepID=A0AAD7ITK7_9AGAR|nr:hypothetical protein B0H16DRAFT_1725547 [Mycena metata]